jgi:hypothetical protein
MNGNAKHIGDGGLPEDLHEISALADRLGAGERASAPEGLEARLIDSARGALHAAPLTLVGDGPVRVRIGATTWAHKGWRIAAVIGLAGGAVIALRSYSTHSTTPNATETTLAEKSDSSTKTLNGLQDDLELLYAIRTPDSQWDSLATDLDLLSTDAETLGTRSTDWAKGAFDEGTM